MKIEDRKIQESIRVRIKPKIWDSTYIMTRSHLDIFQRNIKNKELNRILDLGCEYKPFREFFDDSAEYIGIDFSENSYADHILDLNEETIPYHDEYFDLVIISESLEHIYKTEFFLKEAVRMLKSDGYIFISTPFAFPEHGRPFDFYRFTEFFYKKKLIELGLEIDEIKKSNTIFATPFIIFNLIVTYLPFPKFIKNSFNTVSNLFFMVSEKVLNPTINPIIGKIPKSEGALLLPLGIAIWAKKCR